MLNCLFFFESKGSTFFLVSMSSLGIKVTILSKAISKPLDKLGASSISLFAIKPI